MQKEDKVCNITPANRVGSVQEYYFSKKLKEVAEMNAAGKNVINRRRQPRPSTFGTDHRDVV